MCLVFDAIYKDMMVVRKFTSPSFNLRRDRNKMSRSLQLIGADSLQVLKLSGIETIEGKSAYRYAQDAVYEGTEEEFANKLAQDIQL